MKPKPPRPIWVPIDNDGDLRLPWAGHSKTRAVIEAGERGWSVIKYVPVVPKPKRRKRKGKK